MRFFLITDLQAKIAAHFIKTLGVKGNFYTYDVNTNTNYNSYNEKVFELIILENISIDEF